MRDLNKFTLRQLEIERQKQGKALVVETSLSARQQRTPNYEPILKIIGEVEEILKKRTSEPIRTTLTKKKQRELGLLPKVD